MNQTNLSIKKLQGIKPKGVKTKSETNLSKLIEVKDVLKSCIGVEYSEKYFHLDDMSELINETLHSLEKNYFNNIPLSKLDLESFILSESVNETDEFNSKFNGFYAGLLLTHLTNQNKKEGKRTRFYINGGGNKFDFLFNFVKNFDELIIENFCGNGICDNVLSRGKANTLFLKNIKGDFIAQAGCNNGELDIGIFLNNNGYGQGYCFGALSEINTLIANVNLCSVSFQEILSSGKLDLAVFMGDLYGHHPNFDKDTRSENAVLGLAQNKGDINSTILLDFLKGDFGFGGARIINLDKNTWDYDSYSLGRIIHSNVNKSSMPEYFEEIINADENKVYNPLMNQIRTLSPNNKINYNTVLETAKKIRQEHDQLFPN